MVGNSGEGLIFFVSQPRSGSTLIQKIITNNKHVQSSSEPWLLLPFVGIIKPELVHALYNQNYAYNAINEFSNRVGADIMAEMKGLIIRLYNKYFTDDDCTYFLDKTPRYYEILPEIFELFPKAKFIILKRNPIDVLKSMVRSWNLDTFEKLSVVSRDIIVAPKRIHEFIKGHSQSDNVWGIKYEDFIQNPIKQATEIFEWLNISVNPDDIPNFRKNEKIEGIYGDKGNAKNLDKIEKIKYNETLFFQGEKIENFLNGYYHYLTEEFLNEYGYKNNNTGFADNTFNEYKKFVDIKYKMDWNYQEFKDYKQIKEIKQNKYYRRLINYILLAKDVI